MRKVIILLVYVFFLSVLGAGCRDNSVTPEAKDEKNPKQGQDETKQ